MLKKLLFLFLLGQFSLAVFGQKNRYTSFFNEIDSLKDSELKIQKLEN